MHNGDVPDVRVQSEVSSRPRGPGRHPIDLRVSKGAAVVPALRRDHRSEGLVQKREKGLGGFGQPRGAPEVGEERAAQDPRAVAGDAESAEELGRFPDDQGGDEEAAYGGLQLGQEHSIHKAAVPPITARFHLDVHAKVPPAAGPGDGQLFKLGPQQLPRRQGAEGHVHQVQDREALRAEDV